MALQVCHPTNLFFWKTVNQRARGHPWSVAGAGARKCNAVVDLSTPSRRQVLPRLCCEVWRFLDNLNDPENGQDDTNIQVRAAVAILR